MKYIVILCDGMADEPLDKLSGGKPRWKPPALRIWTALQSPRRLEWRRTVPEGMAPGSDTANLSVIGL